MKCRLRLEIRCLLRQVELAREGEGLADADLQLGHGLLVAVEVVRGEIRRREAHHRVGQRPLLGNDLRQRLVAGTHLGQPRIVHQGTAARLIEREHLSLRLQGEAGAENEYNVSACAEHALPPEKWGQTTFLNGLVVLPADHTFD